MEALQNMIMVEGDPLATAVNVIIIVIGIELISLTMSALSRFYK